MEPRDIYDKRKIYETEIAPLIYQLKLKCNVEHMPMFVTVAVANDEKETTYMNDMVYASTDVRLSDHKIGNLLLLINDFQTEPPLHIQSCIKDLQDYLDKINVAIKKGEVLQTELADDKIKDMNGIMNGNDKVGLPHESVDAILSDEFYNDL